MRQNLARASDTLYTRAVRLPSSSHGRILAASHFSASAVTVVAASVVVVEIMRIPLPPALATALRILFIALWASPAVLDPIDSDAVTMVTNSHALSFCPSVTGCTVAPCGVREAIHADINSEAASAQ